MRRSGQVPNERIGMQVVCFDIVTHSSETDRFSGSDRRDQIHSWDTSVLAKVALKWIFQVCDSE
jgi:hypothetical protein